MKLTMCWYNEKNWVNELRDVANNRSKKDETNYDLINQIHEVWYCISAGNKRVTDMDIDVIQMLKAKKLPVAVVLTQFDNLDAEEHEAMEEDKKIIKDLRLKNNRLVLGYINR